MKRFGRAPPAVVATCITMVALATLMEPAVASPGNLYAFSVQVGDSEAYANSVLFDGHYIWVAVETNGAGLLEKMTLTGTVLSKTPVGIAPIEMTYDGARVWVTNYTSSSVSIVDQNGQLVNTIPLATGAHPEGILFDGKYVWVANNGVGNNTVSKFDAASTELIANYPVGLAPDGLAFDGTYVWVTNSDSNDVMKLNRESGAVLRTYPTGIFPLSIIFDGKDMWVGNGDVASAETPALSTASLTKLRAAGGVFQGTFAAGNAVRGLAYDGNSIWACNSADGTFTRVRASDGAPMGTYAVGKAPRAIAYDGVHMWIANSGDNTLSVVSSQSASIVVQPAVAIAPAFGIYTNEIRITPQLLPPLGTTNTQAASTITAIQSRFTPSVATLGGILDEILDGN